jgi:hypothetical protein
VGCIKNNGRPHPACGLCINALQDGFTEVSSKKIKSVNLGSFLAGMPPKYENLKMKKKIPVLINCPLLLLCHIYHEIISKWAEDIVIIIYTLAPNVYRLVGNELHNKMTTCTC